MTGSRSLSQAISEGDGISVIAPATDLESVQVAEAQGAEGVVVDRDLAGLREATTLPILWRGTGSPAEALRLGADACLVVGESLDEDAEQVERRYAEELELALERLDPEIFLLSPRRDDGGDDPLALVLDLLPDVPAGKLAIADLDVTSRDEVAELERAGVDAVMVGTPDVAGLVGAAPPEV